MASSITMGGFFSGIDTTSIIKQLDAVNRAQATSLQSDISALDDKSAAYSAIASSLKSLQSTLDVLNDPELFRARAATSSDKTVGTATASTSALAGSVKLEVIQLATASSLRSGGSVTDIPSSGALATDVFGSSVVGSFTINNTQLSITGTDTIASIVTKLNGVAGVTASYDNSTGKFTLNSTGNLILGATADSSNFLQGSQLFNSNVTGVGSKTVTSALAVGRLDTTKTLGSISNFAGIAGSLSGGGTLTINGVGISYATTDTVDSLITNINNSDAGVVATYDDYTGEFVLTSKTRGALGITVADGELAQALKMRTSGDTSTTLGTATQFKVNGGAVRESSDGVLTEDELGVTGLTFNPLAVGTTTVTITPDTEAVEKAINAFVEQYNSTQNVVDSYTLIDTSSASTSSTTSENNGILASDGALTFMPSDLRSAINSMFNSSGTILMLEDLGVSGNADDNTLTKVDATKLESALNDHLDEVINLFTRASTGSGDTGGLYTSLTSMIDSYTSSSSGIITNRQESIEKEQTRLDEEIVRINEQADKEKAYLEQQFAVLEKWSAYQAQVTSLLDQLSSSSSKDK